MSRGAAQHVSDALQTRDRADVGAWYGPGSAPHHFAVLVQRRIQSTRLYRCGSTVRAFCKSSTFIFIPFDIITKDTIANFTAPEW